jgi:DNA-directed RNA polymerase subunit H (RpoH/RPB5)
LGKPSQDTTTLAIEMQSGDVIEITARSFDIPAW